MTIGCIVLDFDGTFTQAEKEAAPFLDAFRDAVANELGMDPAEFFPRWQATRERILARPEYYGWRHNGKIVAPANADPYVLATAVAEELVSGAALVRSPEERSERIQAIYRRTYSHTVTSFRDEARRVLAAIAATAIPTFIVTNARPDRVKEKLLTLDEVLAQTIPIHGDALKYEVSEPRRDGYGIEAVPASLEVPGAPRPLLPRRGRYFDVLHEVWATAGAGPADTLVCGDIFELDLLLPMQLGASVHLLTSDNTPAYEIALLERHPSRASHSRTLDPLLSKVIP